MSRHVISEETRGVFAIAVTPFSTTGAIDYASVDRVLDFYVEQRVHGITILPIRKEILFRRGAIASPALRAPGAALSTTDAAELDRLMTRLERRLGDKMLEKTV
jgi:dihydrodipicolinate synthase/N-acetylneuraminate lyase